MGLERKEVKAILKKGDMVRFSWKHLDYEQIYHFWSVDSLDNEVEEDSSLHLIMQEPSSGGSAVYNLDLGVYIYKLVRNDYKLIAIITDKGIKEIKKCSKSKKKS